MNGSKPVMDIDSDPEIQAALNELQSNVSKAQVEVKQLPQELAEATAASQPKEEPPPASNPAEDAKWTQLEAQYGIASEHPEYAHEAAELSHEITHTVENLAEQIFEHRHHPATEKELQWFYAQGSNRVGPVAQTELLKLHEGGDIEWSTLVWNKKLKDWAKASDTELQELSQASEPPPLPPPLPGKTKKAQKEQKCRACGRINAPNDRFCAGCGKPLRSARK